MKELKKQILNEKERLLTRTYCLLKPISSISKLNLI